MSDQATVRIRELNDQFRQSIGTASPLGKIYMTAGVVALGEPFGLRTIAAIKAFDAFTSDIDPHNEHDMVRVTVDAVIVWGKIDYFSSDDPDLGSEDPADPAKTERVMTIMLPEEY